MSTACDAGPMRGRVFGTGFAALVAAGALAAPPAVAAQYSVACTPESETVPYGGDAGIRAAIHAADAADGASTITLAAGCAYPSFSTTDNDWYGSNDLPPISNAITIAGRGSTLSVTPGFHQRLFFIGADPGELATSGWVTPGAGDLTLEDLTLSGGFVRGGISGTGGGGMGAGGAIFNQGKLTLDRVTMTGNEALGGAAGGSGFGSGGGGINTNVMAGQTTGGGFGASFIPPAGSPPGTPGSAAAAGSGGSLGGTSGGGGSGEPVPVYTSSGGNGGAFGAGGTGGSAGAYVPNIGPINGGGGGGGGVGGGGGAGGAPFFGSEGGPGGGGGLGAGGGAAGSFGDADTAAIGGAGGFGGGGGAGSTGGAGGFGGGTGSTTSGGGGAGFGGAIFSQAGSVTINDSTISGNAADRGTGAGSSRGDGAAIFVLGGTLTVNDSTITDNVASNGTDIYVLAGNAAIGAATATATLQNTVAGTVEAGSGATVTATDHDLVTALQVTGTGKVTGTASSADPFLGPLAANGGPGMETLLPGAASPLLKTADPSTSLSVDERGTPRPPACPDIGAIEVTTACSQDQQPPPPGNPQPPVSTVTGATVSGTTAHVKLSCGSGTGSCSDTASLTVVETVSGTKVLAVTAVRTKRRRTIRKTVTLAHSNKQLAAGTSATISLKLSHAGAALLRKRHVLKTKLTVAQGSETVATKTLAFRAPKRRHRRRH